MKAIDILILASISMPLASTGEALHLSSQGSKPLQDICLQLEDKLHWRVSYEDPHVFARDELESGVTPGGVSHLVMRALPLSIDLVEENTYAPEAKRTAITRVVDAYNKSGNRGLFADIQAGDFIHIVPTAVRSEDGVPRSFQPMLDTPVTVRSGMYFLGVLVSQVISQVGQTRGIPIAQATVPINLFAQVMIQEEAFNEPARDVLVRAFNKADEQRIANHATPARLTWYLPYNPNGQHYFFNVNVVGPEQAPQVVPKSRREQTDPAAATSTPPMPTAAGSKGARKPN